MDYYKFPKFFQMSTHSIESKTKMARLQQRLTSEVPQAYSSVCGFFAKQEIAARPMLRRCESANALAKRPRSNQPSSQLSQLQIKYKALEEDYRRLLQQVKNRNELFGKQRQEVERLALLTQKQERQINQLRQMLRMTEKRSLGIQTEDQEGSSWRKRIEVSTGESQLTSQTRCERKSARKQSQSRDKLLCRKTTTIITSEKSRLIDSRMMKTSGVNAKQKAPLAKKYKFIPTLNFRHA